MTGAAPQVRGGLRGFAQATLARLRGSRTGPNMIDGVDAPAKAGALGMVVNTEGRPTGRVVDRTRSLPRAYAAGETKRSDPDFVPPNRGLNVQNQRNLDLAKRKVRALMLDNPSIKGACGIFERNIVGSKGIFPEPATGIPELDEQIEDLYWTYAAAVDVGREMSIVDSQKAFVREIWSGGDVLNHMPIAPEYRGFEMGPAIELIDGDRLPLSFTVPLGDTNTPLKGIVQGVEFDALGRRVAYHVLKSNPYDSVTGAFGGGFGGVLGSRDGVTKINAMDAVLAFVPLRLGQIRGVPWPVSIVETTRLEESFTEAELLLAKIRAAFGAVVTGATGAALPDSKLEGKLVDDNGNPIAEVYPGMVGYLPTGTDVKFPNPTSPGQGLAMTEELLQRRMAAGLGIGYGLLTRDRSKSTFSSDRADSIEDAKQWRDWQMQQVWNQHTRPFYRRLIDWGFLTGKFKLNAAQKKYLRENPQAKYNCTVILPGGAYVNPLQEAQANEVDLRTGAKSLADVCGAMGNHWADVIEQRLQEEAYERDARARLGLPPRAATAGATPATPSNPTQPSQRPDNTNAPAGTPGQDNKDQPDNQNTQDGTENDAVDARAWASARRRTRRGGVA